MPKLVSSSSVGTRGAGALSAIHAQMRPEPKSANR
jgi:hypothetical protein